MLYSKLEILLNKVLFLVVLFISSTYCDYSFAGRAKEFGNNKNVYVTEWSKLKHQAELGDPEALFTLGNYYFEPPKGSNFRRNYKKAGDLYFQASLRQNASAQYNVALMLHKGLGFDIDIIESYVWFYLASTNDSPVAKHINQKTSQVVEQLRSEFNAQQLSDADSRIKFYQSIIKSKRYRDARLPSQS